MRGLRVDAMEQVHQFLSVLYVGLGNPFVVLGAIAFPLYEVLETSTPSARVEDGFDLVFLFSFNHYRGWLFLSASRDSVSPSWIKVRHMEYWMDTHGRRELEFVSERSHLFEDLERA
jgi:hypothetical protein